MAANFGCVQNTSVEHRKLEANLIAEAALKLEDADASAPDYRHMPA